LHPAPSSRRLEGGRTGAELIGGENLIAYDLDRLFRAEQRPNANLDYPRAKAARIY
jgi:hypothetical protein